MGRQKVHNPFHRQNNLDKFGHHGLFRGPAPGSVKSLSKMETTTRIAAQNQNDDVVNDSPDSEAELEPGSPDLMSAAWVERMARDPGLQRTLRRGGMPPGFDIVSALERLDLAERRQLIYVGARREEAEQVIEEAEVRADALRAEVAEAERRRDAAVAEANRRLAERYATNTVAGG